MIAEEIDEHTLQSLTPAQQSKFFQMNADDVEGGGPEQQQIDGDEEYDDREDAGYGVHDNGGYGDDPRRSGKWADRTPSNYAMSEGFSQRKNNKHRREHDAESFNPDAQYYGPGDTNYPSSLKKNRYQQPLTNNYVKNAPNGWPRTKGEVQDKAQSAMRDMYNKQQNKLKFSQPPKRDKAHSTHHSDDYQRMDNQPSDDSGDDGTQNPDKMWNNIHNNRNQGMLRQLQANNAMGNYYKPYQRTNFDALPEIDEEERHEQMRMRRRDIIANVQTEDEEDFYGLPDGVKRVQDQPKSRVINVDKERQRQVKAIKDNRMYTVPTAGIIKKKNGGMHMENTRNFMHQEGYERAFEECVVPREPLLEIAKGSMFKKREVENHRDYNVDDLKPQPLQLNEPDYGFNPAALPGNNNMRHQLVNVYKNSLITKNQPINISTNHLIPPRQKRRTQYVYAEENRPDQNDIPDKMRAAQDRMAKNFKYYDTMVSGDVEGFGLYNDTYGPFENFQKYARPRIGEMYLDNKMDGRLHRKDAMHNVYAPNAEMPEQYNNKYSHLVEKDHLVKGTKNDIKTYSGANPTAQQSNWNQQQNLLRGHNDDQYFQRQFAQEKRAEQAATSYATHANGKQLMNGLQEHERRFLDEKRSQQGTAPAHTNISKSVNHLINYQRKFAEEEAFTQAPNTHVNLPSQNKFSNHADQIRNPSKKGELSQNIASGVAGGSMLAQGDSHATLLRDKNIRDGDRTQRQTQAGTPYINNNSSNAQQMQSDYVDRTSKSRALKGVTPQFADAEYYHARLNDETHYEREGPHGVKDERVLRGAAPTIQQDSNTFSHLLFNQREPNQFKLSEKSFGRNEATQHTSLQQAQDTRGIVQPRDYGTLFQNKMHTNELATERAQPTNIGPQASQVLGAGAGLGDGSVLLRNEDESRGTLLRNAQQRAQIQDALQGGSMQLSHHIDQERHNNTNQSVMIQQRGFNANNLPERGAYDGIHLQEQFQNRMRDKNFDVANTSQAGAITQGRAYNFSHNREESYLKNTINKTDKLNGVTLQNNAFEKNGVHGNNIDFNLENKQVSVVPMRGQANEMQGNASKMFLQPEYERVFDDRLDFNQNVFAPEIQKELPNARQGVTDKNILRSGQDGRNRVLQNLGASFGIGTGISDGAGIGGHYLSNNAIEFERLAPQANVREETNNHIPLYFDDVQIDQVGLRAINQVHDTRMNKNFVNIESRPRENLEGMKTALSQHNNVFFGDEDNSGANKMLMAFNRVRGVIDHNKGNQQLLRSNQAEENALRGDGRTMQADAIAANFGQLTQHGNAQGVQSTMGFDCQRQMRTQRENTYMPHATEVLFDVTAGRSEALADMEFVPSNTDVKDEVTRLTMARLGSGQSTSGVIIPYAHSSTR